MRGSGAGIGVTQVAEVELRHHRPRQIVVPVEGEDGRLERGEPAVGDAGAPERPGHRVEVEVGDLRPPPGRPGQEVARLQQRQVERPAVEGDELTRLGQPRADRRQEGRLGPEVAEEVLGDPEPTGRPRGQPDQEDVGPGPARQPRGLGVEEDGPVEGRGRLDARGPRHVLGAPQGDPVRRLHALQGERGRRRPDGRRGAGTRGAGLDPPDDLAEARELGGRAVDHSGAVRLGAGRGGRRRSAWPDARPGSPGPRTTGSRPGTGTRRASRARGRPGAPAPRRAAR